MKNLSGLTYRTRRAGFDYSPCRFYLPQNFLKAVRMRCAAFRSQSSGSLLPELRPTCFSSIQLREWVIRPALFECLLGCSAPDAELAAAYTNCCMGIR